MNPVRSLWRGLALLLALLVPSAFAAAAPGNGPRLTAFSGLLQKKVVGKLHLRFGITADSNQLLEFTIDPNNAPVRILLRSPQGEVLLNSKSAEDSWNPEILAALSTIRGTYILEVEANSSGAKGGNFRLALAPRRPATANDKLRVAAQSAYLSGAEQFLSDPPQMEKAQASFKEGVRLAREGKDTFREAQCFYLIGAVHERNGDTAKALEAETTALDLYKQIGHKYGTATALNEIGWLHYGRSETTESFDEQSRALELWKDLGDSYKHGQAVSQSYIGAALFDANRYEDALVRHTEAARLFREIGDNEGESQALDSLAHDYARLQEPQEAVDAYVSALKLSILVHNSQSEAETRINLAKTYSDLGENALARDQYDLALSKARRLKDRHLESRALNGLGFAYGDLQQFDRSILCLRQAIDIDKSTNEIKLEIAPLSNISSVYQKMGRLSDAVASAEEAHWGCRGE